jgi:cell wall assembly regulator SMI1
MGTSEAILLAFAAQWSHPSYPPVKVEPAELQAAEATLGVRFPEDYKTAILSVGRPFPSLALLSAISDHSIDLRALSELSTPKEIVEETVGWREIGLPDNFVVIGNDFSGNKFCFDVADLQGDAVASAPVYFWDHDFDDVQLVASSFPEWIGSYLGEWSADLSYKDF